MSQALLILKEARRRNSTGRDVALSAVQGVQDIPGTIVGLPGDINRLSNESQLAAARVTARVMGLSRAETSRRLNRIRTEQRFSQYAALPTSERVTGWVEGATGWHYTPQTNAGRVSRVATSLLPAAAGGVGSVIRAGVRAGARAGAGATTRGAVSRAASRVAVEAPPAPGTIRLYHGTPSDVATGALRPSANGVSGPGLYNTTTRTHAAQYGDNIHTFDVPDRFISQREFDALTRVTRSAARAAEQLARRGFIGVRDGVVHTLWSNPAAQRAAVGAGAGGSTLAVAGAAAANEGESTADHERAMAGAANGRVWVRGFYRTMPRRAPVWVRGHWARRAAHH